MQKRSSYVNINSLREVLSFLLVMTWYFFLKKKIRSLIKRFYFLIMVFCINIIEKKSLAKT